MFDIPCVIFAGGKSSRMGKDKALLPFGDFNTLTQYQLNKLSKLFKDVYISCKSKDKFDFLANFIEDINTQDIFAPTAGFITVFDQLKCDRFFAISVDTPFIDTEIISSILEGDTDAYDLSIAKTSSGIQPMCGVYHKSLLSSFEKMLQQNNHKLGLLIKNSKANIVNFEDEKPFLNLNNPQEYQQALKLLL